MPSDNSSQKFEEALQLLNEAAREKKEEIQNLIGDKYGHIKDALHEAAVKNRKQFARYRKLTEEALDEGGEKLKDIASDVDAQVHENPWPYIGGVALGALLLGFIMGSSRD